MDSAAAPTRKTRWWFIIGTLVVAGAVFVVCRLAIWHAGSDERARKLSHLSPDECQQVLAECRQILAKKDGWTAQYGGHLVKSRWPTYVCSLNPDGVHIEDNRVSIVLAHSGKHFYGLWAYAKGINPSISEQDARKHESELIPGLWLWEDADGYEVLKWEK